MSDIAALGIRIDTGDVNKAVEDLNRLPTAGERATRAVKNLADIAKEFAIGFGQGARQGWREYFDGASRSEQASKRAEKGIKDVSRAGREQEGILSSLSGSIRTLIGGYLSFQAVSSVFRTVIQNTIQAEQEQAQLAAVLLSTGEAAGFSQQRLNEMAEALAKTSTYSAGAITSAQTRLLSYTGVVGEVFPEAMQATIDMAARMGMSLEQSAETIGRALDIPSQGLTALTRQGFRFTEEQKKVVEQLERTGKTAEAQRIVLDALESSYGGAAAAARDTFGGAVASLRKALEEVTTGKDGSFTEARDAVLSLTATLESDETKRSFETLISLVARTVEALVSAGNEFLNFGRFVGEGLARLVNGSDDPIERIDDRVSELQKNITSLENTLSGPRRGGLPLSAEEIANINEQLAVSRRELKGLEGMRGDFVRQRNNPASGAASNPMTPDRPVRPPGPTGPSQQELKQLNAARLASDLAEYQRQLRAYVGAFSNAEKQVEAIRSAGLLSDQEYFEAKTALVRLNEEAQVRALQQEASRLQRQKVTGAELIKQQTRIADIEAEIQGIRRDSASQVELLAQQQATAARNIARAYEDARDAAKDYLDTIARQNQRELDGMGRGSLQREMDARRNQRDDQYLERRRALDEEFRRNGEGWRAQYERLLQVEREAHQKALAEDDRYWAEKLKKQQDWSIGAMEAIQNYYDESMNIAAQVERAFTNAFQGMEDALVKFITTGKLDFKSLADSIIADITRIIIKQQIMIPIMRALKEASGDNGPVQGGGGFLGLIGQIGSALFAPNAKGNVYTSPGLSAYSGTVVNKPTIFPFARGMGLMGEAGPEAILPLKRGADGKLGVEAGGGGNSMHVTIHQNFPQNTTRATTLQAASDARRVLESASRNM